MSDQINSALRDAGALLGITHEDVRALDGALADLKVIYARASGLHAQKGPILLATLRSLQSRLAAALPPEEP